MTDNLDPKTFDLTDWITGGRTHRPTKTVTVYRDLNLAAAVDRIRDRIESLDSVTDNEGNPEESVGGDTERAELEAEAEELLARMQAAKVDLTVTGLISPEYNKIKERLESKGVKESTDTFSYHVLADAVEFPGGQKLDPEQWAQFHSAIGQGQFIRITQAYQAAMLQVPDVTAPFSRKSSRTGRA